MTAWTFEELDHTWRQRGEWLAARTDDNPKRQAIVDEHLRLFPAKKRTFAAMRTMMGWMNMGNAPGTEPTKVLVAWAKARDHKAWLARYAPSEPVPMFAGPSDVEVLADAVASLEAKVKVLTTRVDDLQSARYAHSEPLELKAPGATIMDRARARASQ